MRLLNPILTPIPLKITLVAHTRNKNKLNNNSIYWQVFADLSNGIGKIAADSSVGDAE
jgi:hypothetical protein